MLTHQGHCSANAATSLGFVDITDDVQAVVSGASVSEGRVTILRNDDGCALVLNERETGLHADVQATVQRLTNGAGPPPVGSASLVLPVVDGRLYLGTWQRILMIELEEPRERTLVVQVVGE